MSTPLTEDVEDDYDDYYVWPDEGEDEEDLEAAIFDLEAPPLTVMAADAPPYLRVAVECSRKGRGTGFMPRVD